MLIIVSDIHLGDGTCGKSISASAFRLFANRLQELAFNASWRQDGKYRPIEEVNILLLGDILDPLHSTRWLEKGLGEPGYVRPWTDSHASEFSTMLLTITRNILKKNTEAVDFLKGLSGKDGLTLPPATRSGKPDMESSQREPVSVHLYYMIGNHDWYYHLTGPAFDTIREEIAQAFGLSNPPGPFPHDLNESASLKYLLDEHKVYARHGDIYDPFNFNMANSRDSATLGDAFVVEIVNRFPIEVEHRVKDDLQPGILENLHELSNVRPTLATPMWIGSQLRQNNVNQVVQQKIKDLWNEVFDEFLAIPFVKRENKPYQLDIIDGLELAIHLTDRLSFTTIDEIFFWARKLLKSDEITYAHHALKEKAFLDRNAQYIVYGHTHHYEIVPLDSFQAASRLTNQIYMNSGTWHTYFDLATYKPEEKKFVPYQVLTYLTFYKDDERGGTSFETWSGTISD